MMTRVKPPRSAFLNFPLGHQCGKPNDVELQTRILKDTLNVLVAASHPGEIVDLPYEWDSAFDFSDFMKALETMLQEEGAEPQDWRPDK
ncbi:MAG: hypothetical protein Kow0099_31420 [Candidatus Abyssubacteria bacterium]